jgi:hypothetical protein
MHERILPRIRVGVAGRMGGGVLAVALAGCLDRNAGLDDPTVVEPSTGDSSSSSGSTTIPGIMTTTVDSGHGGSDSDGTTAEPVPEPCGNGKIDPPELCDQGEANSDAGECTLACRWNVCGDGRVHAGDETCDDGPDNGKYGHCDMNCDGPAERCGDLSVQADEGEMCDENDPHFACLKECTWATSCTNIKASWGDEATTGIYLIRRMSQFLTVWCDMDADGGGYTFIKYASGTVLDDHNDPEYPFSPIYLSALQAEQKCGYWGLRLFAPRSPEHLAAAVGAANAKQFAPIQKDTLFPPYPEIDSDVEGYLSIMGVYPVTPGTSCVGKALNSEACPEWAIKPDPLQPDVVLPYWVSDTPIANQPNTTACAGCSLFYHWNIVAQPPQLAGYITINMMNKGAISSHFLCELGDKLGPPG